MGRSSGYRALGLGVLVFTLVLVGLPALLVRGCSCQKLEMVEKGRPVVKLRVTGGRVLTLPLEEYLVGVVAAEMPAEFAPEALKAQAVAARTYTLSRISGGSVDNRHPGVPLCDDPGHCQAWLSISQLRRKWGLLSFGYNYRKIAEAVEATAGQVLVYQNQLIDPVYHASCGGRGTEDAREVWGEAIPYLTSVSCHWDPVDRQQPVVAAFTFNELFNSLGIDEKMVPVARDGGLVQILEKTVSGRVRRVRVGTRVLTGVDLRKRLKLRSTDFTTRVTADGVAFYTRGYGHAVGMCQYGAQGMAKQGYTYREILSHYYPGTAIRVIKTDR